MTDAERKREWRKNNPEKHREQQRAYYKRKAEKVKARVKKYRENNPEKVAKQKANRLLKLKELRAIKNANKPKPDPDRRKKSRAAYRESHKEEIREYNLAYRKANPEKIKKLDEEWKKANIDKVRITRAIRRTRKAQSGGRFTADEWFTLCFACGFKCLCCGEQRPLEADHVVPVALGGSSFLHNIQPLCRECNLRKNAKHIDYRYPELSISLVFSLRA